MTGPRLSRLRQRSARPHPRVPTRRWRSRVHFSAKAPTSPPQSLFNSTNLVAELGIILAVLMGWQFTVAEFAGAPVMVTILVVLFRAFLRPDMVRQAKEQAD